MIRHTVIAVLPVGLTSWPVWQNAHRALEADDIRLRIGGTSLYTFLASLPSLLALAGFVIYQLVGANRAGDSVTQRIVDKLRSNAAGEVPASGLTPKAVAELLRGNQRLRQLVDQQDFELLRTALKQQFVVSLFVYLLVALMFGLTVFLFTRPTPLTLDRVALVDLNSDAKGLLVDLDELSVTWIPTGPQEDIKIHLENLDSSITTDPITTSSGAGRVTFSPDSLRKLLAQRQPFASNRMRAVLQGQKQSFTSDPQEVRVGITILVVADKTGIAVAAMVDNRRIDGYSFETKVIVPAKTGDAFFSIGPAISARAPAFKVAHPELLDWTGLKVVYLGPDDSRLVRTQKLVADEFQSGHI